jgi:hypothetical protein
MKERKKRRVDVASRRQRAAKEQQQELKSSQDWFAQYEKRRESTSAMSQRPNKIQ